MEMFPPETILPHDVYEQEKKNILKGAEIEVEEAMVIVLSVRSGARKKKGALMLPAEASEIHQVSSRCHDYYVVDFEIMDSGYTGSAQYIDKFDKRGVWHPRWVYQRFQDDISLKSGYFIKSRLHEEEFDKLPELINGVSG